MSEKTNNQERLQEIENTLEQCDVTTNTLLRAGDYEWMKQTIQQQAKEIAEANAKIAELEQIIARQDA